jgi:DsbC/DsbD-like thiol-disulfide interchange protein
MDVVWGVGTGEERPARAGTVIYYSFHPEVKAHKRFAMCETCTVPEQVAEIQLTLPSDDGSIEDLMHGLVAAYRRNKNPRLEGNDATRGGHDS